MWLASLEGTILDEVLTLTNEPERYFFAMLDQELEKISRFYNGKRTSHWLTLVYTVHAWISQPLFIFIWFFYIEKEQEAKNKYEALKMQVELVRQYRQRLSEVKHADDDTLEHRLNPMHWFHTEQPLNATAPSSTTIAPTILPDGDHHMSYRVR